MKTSFGFFNSTVYTIRDWHQMLKVKSSIPNIACAVNDVSDDTCEGTSLTIYDKTTKFNYITFFVEGNDSKEVDLSKVVLTSEEAVQILITFGFNVYFAGQLNIDYNTKSLLRSLKDLGFNFICKNNKNVVYVTKNDDPSLVFNEGVMVTDVIPNALDCDFTFMEYSHIYSIERLLMGE